MTYIVFELRDDGPRAKLAADPAPRGPLEWTEELRAKADQVASKLLHRPEVVQRSRVRHYREAGQGEWQPVKLPTLTRR